MSGQIFKTFLAGHLACGRHEQFLFVVCGTPLLAQREKMMKRQPRHQVEFSSRLNHPVSSARSQPAAADMLMCGRSSN